MADCCDPIVPPRNCKPRCNPYIDAACVIDASAHSCLGTDEDATQAEINAAINNLLCCHTWSDIDLTDTGWSDVTDAQTVQYSNTNRCIVRLRGSITRFETSGNVFRNVDTLPVGSRPLLTRYYSAFNIGTQFAYMYIRIQGLNDVSPGLITVYIGSIFAPVNVTVSFDGLTFETN